MAIAGDYRPSPRSGTRNQVEVIERTGTTDSVDIMGRPVVLLTMIGARTGAVRKVPLMRVEHGGAYAMVGSQGGRPTDPAWVSNLRAHPQITVQDGPEPWDGVAREVTGEEKRVWWERAVAAFPSYADYQRKTDREIPVFVVERAG